MNPPRPTRARFVLVLWLCALAGVLYLDRLCMGQAAAGIQRDLKLTNTELAYAHMAFTIAYGLFEIPTGLLGDRVGARAVLVRIVLWWSAFTALTGLANGLAVLIAVRFLFGAGEAGAYPNVARVLSTWVPAAERGRVQGVMLFAAQFGGAVAPAVAAELIGALGWRWAFAAFGVLGIVWAAGFRWWFRNDPADHAGVNAAELAHIRAGTEQRPKTHAPVPWRAVAGNRTIWALGLLMVCSAFNSYLLFSWFAKYLHDARDVPETESGWLTSVTLLGSAIGVLAGGPVADRVTRSGRPAFFRRVLGATAFATAALGLFVGVRVDSPLAMATLVGVSTLAMHFTLPTWWSAAIEVSGRHVGALFGLMNGVGVVGALASQWFVGAFADRQLARGLTGRAQWDPMFDVYFAFLMAGAALWAVYAPRPLEKGPVS